jgi:ATP-binding cassette subfamily B protein
VPPSTVTRPLPALGRTRSTTSLWRLRGYLRPYVGSLVIMLTTATAGVLVALSIPLVTGRLIDGPLSDGDRGAILPLGMLALGLGILEALLILIRRWVQAAAVLGVERQLRDDIYTHLDSLPMSFHARWQSGQLLSRITTDLSTIRRFTGFGMLFLIINVLQLVVTTALLLHLYWPLGLVVAFAAVPIVLLSMSFERRLRARLAAGAGRAGRRRHRGRGVDARNPGDQVLRAQPARLREVRPAGFAALRVADGQGRAVRALLDLPRGAAEHRAGHRAAPGARAVGNGSISIGVLVAFITVDAVAGLARGGARRHLSMAQEAMTAADRVVEIFDTESEIVGGSRVLEEPRGHLRLEGVGFRFADATTDVLHNVDLEVLPGETVAVVGATGSGKTVLTSLIPRLRPTAGRILIDGVDSATSRCPTCAASSPPRSRSRLCSA